MSRNVLTWYIVPITTTDGAHLLQKVIYNPSGLLQEPLLEFLYENKSFNANTTKTPFLIIQIIFYNAYYAYLLRLTHTFQ